MSLALPTSAKLLVQDRKAATRLAELPAEVLAPALGTSWAAAVAARHSRPMQPASGSIRELRALRNPDKVLAAAQKAATSRASARDLAPGTSLAAAAAAHRSRRMLQVFGSTRTARLKLLLVPAHAREMAALCVVSPFRAPEAAQQAPPFQARPGSPGGPGTGIGSGPGKGSGNRSGRGSANGPGSGPGKRSGSAGGGSSSPRGWNLADAVSEAAEPGKPSRWGNATAGIRGSRSARAGAGSMAVETGLMTLHEDELKGIMQMLGADRAHQRRFRSETGFATVPIAAFHFAATRALHRQPGALGPGGASAL